MRTQFIVRSLGNKYSFELKTVLCEGVEITRFREDEIEMFEINDPDVVVELVVRKKSPCGSTESKVDSGNEKLSSDEPQQTGAAAVEDNLAVVNLAAQKTDTPEENSTAKKVIVNPSKPAAKQIEDNKKSIHSTTCTSKKPNEPMENNQITASNSSQNSHATKKVVSYPNIWNERFNQLQEFKRKHGNCYVPKSYSKTLHHWVDQQRKYFREGRIDEGRLQRLNEIGFSWNACESRWSLRYSQLMLYKKQHGHCRVPQKYAENPQLGEWVIQQRKEFRNGKITEDRIARLNELDFTWDGRSDRGKSLNASHEDDDDEDGLMEF